MKIILLGIFLLNQMVLFSQTIPSEVPEKNLFFGLKGGLNIANIPKVLEEVKENNPRFGFHMGGFLDFYMDSKWYLQPELYYSKQGTNSVFLFRNDVFPQGIDVHADFKLDYLNFPLLINWKFYKNFHLGAGPYVGFLLKKRAHIYTPDYVQSQYGVSIDEEGDIDDIAASLSAQGYILRVKTQKTDFGFNLDFGYDFKQKYGLNLRYGQGLTTLLKSEDGSYNASPRNSVFVISFHYIFQ